MYGPHGCFKTQAAASAYATMVENGADEWALLAKTVDKESLREAMIQMSSNVRENHGAAAGDAFDKAANSL